MSKNTPTRKAGKQKIQFYGKQYNRDAFNAAPGLFLQEREEKQIAIAINVQRKWDLRKTTLLG